LPQMFVERRLEYAGQGRGRGDGCHLRDKSVHQGTSTTWGEVRTL
jgi:hypothetical protein